MSVQWRMHVWQADGTARPTIDLDSSVASLDRFEVDGAGNCLEATWRAKPSAVTIKVRDVIQLQVSTDSGSTWTSVYKGVVVTAGSPRAPGLQAYRAVGLKQRFYELLLEEFVISGGDVATMVDAALTAITLPEGVTYSSSGVPTQSFELGDRYPALEPVGEFLDALAATVGRFLVPAGTGPYTYDGESYADGEIVPATKWGVDADGAFFFRRPQENSVSVSETDNQTSVAWDRTSGEEVYDRVALIYASEYEGVETYRQLGGNEEPIPHPLARTYGSGPYESTRRHPLTAPLDYMEDVAGLWTDSNVTNPGNAFDGDDTTYAEFGSGGGSASLEGISLLRDGAIARVVFEKGADAEPLDIQISWSHASGLTNWVYRYDDTDDSKRIAILPMPLPANMGATDSEDIIVRVQTDDAQGARVYSIEIFVPDETLGEQVAAGFEREPEGDVSRVTLQGQLGTVSQTMSLTPRGEAAIDVPIERIEYQLTRGRGLSTTYFVGQSHDADLLAQKVVLERLAERAASS